MNEQKIIERIRRLLALAEDAASPNEALIAARRARSIMDKHQITKGDIERSTGSQFLETSADKKGSVRKTWILNLGCASGILNDCVFAVTRAPRINYLFQGFKSDAIVAKLTMDYFVDTCERLCANSSTKGVSEKNFFKIGFSEVVLRRSSLINQERELLTLSDGKSLVLSKKDQITEHFGGLKSFKKPEVRKPNNDEMNAYMDGVKCGRNINLDKQLEDESEEIARIAS